MRKVINLLASGIVLFLLMEPFVVSVWAGLCVWRNPDRDIKEIFDADSYKTIFITVTKEKKTIIEKRTGALLDPDETEFKFWPVFKQGKQVGTITTHLVKAEYGAMEVVIALLHNEDKVWVKEVRIQRDREKRRAELRSEKFLSQFKGKTSRDEFEFGKGLKPATEDSLISSKAVLFSVKKQIIAYEELMWKK